MWPKSSSKRWAEGWSKAVTIRFHSRFISSVKRSNSSPAGSLRHQHQEQPQPDASAAGSDAGAHRVGAAAGGRGCRRQHGGRGWRHRHARCPPTPAAGQCYAQPRCRNQQHRWQQRRLFLHVTALQGEWSWESVYMLTYFQWHIQSKITILCKNYCYYHEIMHFTLQYTWNDDGWIQGSVVSYKQFPL